MFFSFLLCCFIFIFHGVTWYSVCLLHYKVHNSGCKVSTNFLNDKFLASFIAEHILAFYCWGLDYRCKAASAGLQGMARRSQGMARSLQ